LRYELAFAGGLIGINLDQHLTDNMSGPLHRRKQRHYPIHEIRGGFRKYTVSVDRQTINVLSPFDMLDPRRKLIRRDCPAIAVSGC
tara:strand:+ start:381 stop:638 length:258 start_codon:yes stop_codon:yes gene_type:complete